MKSHTCEKESSSSSLASTSSSSLTLALSSWLTVPLWKQLKVLSSRAVFGPEHMTVWKVHRPAHLSKEVFTPKLSPPLAGSVKAPNAYKYNPCYSVLYIVFVSIAMFGLLCPLAERSLRHFSFFVICHQLPPILWGWKQERWWEWEKERHTKIDKST